MGDRVHWGILQGKKSFSAGHRWLTPIILPTQEAAIRKIEVQSQPGQIVLETYLEKNKKVLVEWLKV
jgi:hypothetical protein